MINQILETAQKNRKKLLKDLNPPNRDDFTRPARYDQALKKYKRVVNRILRVMMIVVNRYRLAIKYDHQEVTISIGKLNGVMSDGFVIRERECRVDTRETYVDEHGEVHHRSAHHFEIRKVREPRNWNHNHIVRLIVGLFFDEYKSGTMYSGSSKFTAKKTLVINDAHIDMIFALLDCNSNQLKQFDDIFNVPLTDDAEVNSVVKVEFDEIVYDSYDVKELSIVLSEIFDSGEAQSDSSQIKRVEI